jgi:hypothetical protein
VQYGGVKAFKNSSSKDKGYTKIYSNGYAFAALKADGSITAWGDENNTLIKPSALRAAKAPFVE